MLASFAVKGILVGLGASIIALTLFFLRWPLSGVELALYDRNFQWFWAERSPPREIVIVAIDVPSLDKLGPFPWPRAHHAAVIRELAGNGAKAIGVDIGIFEPDRFDPQNDRQLIQATADAGSVIYPMVFEEFEQAGRRRVQAIRPLSELAAVAAGYGHAHLEQGPDGIVRSVHLAYRDGETTFWRIDLETLRRYLGVPESAVRPLRRGVIGIGSIEVPVSSGVGPQRDAETPIADYEMNIGYVGGAGTFEQVSALDVMEGRFPQNYFENKIALYGATASGLGDSHMTPMSGSGRPMSGVEIQANVINTILAERFLRRSGWGLTILLTVLGATAIGGVYSRFRAKSAFWLMLSTLSAGILVYLIAFNTFGYWFDIAPIPVALLLSFTGSAAVFSPRRDRREELAKDHEPAAHPGSLPTVSREWRPLEPGTTLADRYVIERDLGRGGMGIVYQAYDREIGEQVALKFVLGSDARNLERMQREIRFARKVTHRNVVRVHDCADFHGWPFLTMEFVEGITLTSLLARQERLELPEAISLAIDICSGVSAAHQMNLVHRDLKPQNIMVTSDRHAKVLDFGLAKPPGDLGLTGTGELVGTVGYMSPEQANGEKSIDARSDIFSLGVLFYEMFTGTRPFEAPTSAAILARVITHQPPKPSSLRPELPHQLDEIILRCLEKNAGDRFQTVAAVESALRVFLEDRAP